MGSASCKRSKSNSISPGGTSEADDQKPTAMQHRLSRAELQQQQLHQHQRIEAQLRRERVEERRVVKLLLLGSSDSGKSTITKQMRILHSGGFNDSELIDYRYVLRANLITCYHHVAEAIAELGVIAPESEYDGNEKETQQQLVEMFQSSHTKLFDCDEDDQVRALSAMGTCGLVKEAVRRLGELHHAIPDNCKYLLSRASSISQTNYKPNEEDVIHARASTTGVHEINFTFRRINIRLIDVGGQRAERRKWIHCFDSVTAVLFVASLASYDQLMEEESQTQKNRMEDAVQLFQRMQESPHLSHAPFILFLNKKDIFAEKLAISPLSDFFPAAATYCGYTTVDHNSESGGKQQQRKRSGKDNSSDNNNSYSRAVDFIIDLFLRSPVTGLRLDEESNDDGDGDGSNGNNSQRFYTHVTNATDRGNINFMFGAACDVVLKRNVGNSGMA